MLVGEPLRIRVGSEERTFRELVCRDLEEELESASLRRIVDQETNRCGLVLADRRVGAQRPSRRSRCALFAAGAVRPGYRSR